MYLLTNNTYAIYSNLSNNYFQTVSSLETKDTQVTNSSNSCFRATNAKVQFSNNNSNKYYNLNKNSVVQNRAIVCGDRHDDIGIMKQVTREARVLVITAIIYLPVTSGKSKMDGH